MSDTLPWLVWNESQTFERKSCFDKSAHLAKPIPPKTVSLFIAETICAKANADGGVLLVGQENLREDGEDGGGEVTGVPYNQDSLDQLRTAPSRLILPTIDSVVEKVHEVQSKVVLVFQVGPSPDAHHLTDGRCVLRIGTSNQPYNCGTVAQLKDSQSPYERRSVPEATLDDLDADALDWFAMRIGWKGSHDELLEEYNLSVGKMLNNAGLLLFARKPSRWHDHPEITMVRYFGTKRGLGADYQATPPQRITRPLVRLIEEAYSALEAHIAVRVELRNLFFENHADYPGFAWQEAIINAVGHRDYAITGAGTEIWYFDDHIDIRSPGKPPLPVSVDELRKAAHTTQRGLHLSRNPLIVRVLIDAGYMREQGEGIPRMFHVMDEADLAPPELTAQGFLFVVTLRKSLVYDDETRLWLRQFAVLDLTRQQRRLLASAHSDGDHFTSRAVQKVFQLDPYSASILIRSLVRKGVVRLLEKGRRVYEVILPGETKAVPDDMVALLPRFAETAKLTNRDLQMIWSVPPRTALRRVRALIDGGWLELRGFGRGASYWLANRTQD